MQWLYNFMGWCWHDYDNWVEDSLPRALHLQQSRVCKNCGIKKQKN